MTNANTKPETTKESKESKLEQYFANNKFFQTNDVNGKKAFFCLGLYTRSVMGCLERTVAENGGENKDQKKLTRYATRNMSYKNYTYLIRLLDSFALQCNTKLLDCGGLSRQFLSNAEFTEDKSKLPTTDANNAFSLGLYQQFK
jgi:hypothetical protein